MPLFFLFYDFQVLQLKSELVTKIKRFPNTSHTCHIPRKNRFYVRINLYKVRWMDVDGCGCNFDLDVIWKTGSKIREKQFRFFLSTFLRSLGRNCSNDTLFEAVGLMLTYTHPQPSESLIKNFKTFFAQNSIWCHRKHTECFKSPKKLVS